MGVSVEFHGAPDGGDGPFSLATTRGWALFGRWAESLPAADYPAVRGLADAGEWRGSDALAGQLGAALAAHPPGDGVGSTARGLLANLGVGDPDETATVTGEG